MNKTGNVHVEPKSISNKLILKNPANSLLQLQFIYVYYTLKCIMHGICVSR